jgi:hypothetical protein
LENLFLLLPPYALGGGLLALTSNQVTAELLEEYGTDTYVHPLSWELLGKNVFVLLLQVIIFHIVNLLLEYSWFDGFRQRYSNVLKITILS